MSHMTIYESTQNERLLCRIKGALAKEAWANEALGATSTGQTVRTAGPDFMIALFVWPVCVDYEDEYAYAVDQGNQDPGGDPGVITDANISTAVQAHWPRDPITGSSAMSEGTDDSASV